MIPRRKVLIVTNAEWYFLSHRVALACALRDEGYEVVVAAEAEQGRGSAIEALGFRFVRLPLHRRSANPLAEMRTIRALRALYRVERPWAVHHITIKPVIYGSIVARVTGVPVIVNTIPGLGYMFTGRGAAGAARRRVALALYRAALGGNVRAIFQNPEDRELFVSHGVISDDRATVVLGSGVDTHAFQLTPEPPGVPIVVMPSRLLWDKGVGELVDAARILAQRGIVARVALVGAPDEQNPASVPESTLRSWAEDGVVEWWGFRDDMPEVLRSAHVVALPSYREGVPKVLLEAAAAGRPIVTTAVPGCREVVTDGVNGLVVPPRDPRALADALERLATDAALRASMGAAGRERAVRQFSAPEIAAETLRAYPVAR